MHSLLITGGKIMPEQSSGSGHARLAVIEAVTRNMEIEN